MIALYSINLETKEVSGLHNGVEFALPPKILNEDLIALSLEECEEFLSRQISSIEFLAKNKYKSLRILEYPPLTDLADAMYWASHGDNTKLEAYYGVCEAVKLKYPKANNE